MKDSYEKGSVTKGQLEQGGKDFEVFWLRPKKMANKEAILRMRINKGWSGWKLKDGLIRSVGLDVGDTINTEISVLNGIGLIENADDTDLFASGVGADWLLDNNVGSGSVIDAKVKFVYSKAPIGGREGRDIWKLSLVFVEGYAVVEQRCSSSSKKETVNISSISGIDISSLLE